MIRIANGLVVDGTGTPAFVGDVVVDGDRIVDVIKPQRAQSSQRNWGSAPDPKTLCDPLRSLWQKQNSKAATIDATGCLVTPGFIDCHTHSDAYLVVEPDAPSKISQGITTEVNGQCGGSVAPRYGEARLSSDWATILGERLTWHSMAEYREVLEAAKPAVNTVQFVGHNTLRSSVMGYAARTATADKIGKMERLLAESMDEGAHGLTTGLIYQPGKYSTPDEVEALARVAAKRGGIYATHMRSEGDRILEAIDEVIDLARRTGIRAEISHLKTSGKNNWSKIDAVIGKIEGGMKEGVLLGSDRYPYCAAGTDLDVVFPDWAQEGAARGEIERLKDHETFERIVRELDESGRDWSTVMVGGVWCEANRQFSGRTIAGILAGHQPPTSAGRLVCEMLLRDGCKTGAFFFTMSERNLDRILSLPWILPGTDASLRAPWGPLGADHPHPRAYGTMPEFYRRLRALGVAREEAIARMTSRAAERFGLKGRGVVAKGAFADLVVWDENNFASTATYTDPHRFSTGVKLTMVNGAIPYRDGRFTGDRSGRFL